jgi:hypothetical protein
MRGKKKLPRNFKNQQQHILASSYNLVLPINAFLLFLLIVYTSPSFAYRQTRCIHLSSALRGGASEQDKDTGTEGKKTLARPTNLWGSISSAFQLNIDAKDELIHERYDRNDDDRDGRRDEFVKIETKNELESDLEIKDSVHGNITVIPKDVDAEDVLEAVQGGPIKVTQSIDVTGKAVHQNHGKSVERVDVASYNVKKEQGGGGGGGGQS